MKNILAFKIIYFVIGIALSVFLLYRLVVTEEFAKWDYVVLLVIIGLSFLRKSLFKNPLSKGIDNSRS